MASSRSARTMLISSIISKSNVRMMSTLAFRKLFWLSGSWYSVTNSGTSGR